VKTGVCRTETVDVWYCGRACFPNKQLAPDQNAGNTYKLTSMMFCTKAFKNELIASGHKLVHSHFCVKCLLNKLVPFTHSGSYGSQGCQLAPAVMAEPFCSSLFFILADGLSACWSGSITADARSKTELPCNLQSLVDTPFTHHSTYSNWQSLRHLPNIETRFTVPKRFWV